MSDLPKSVVRFRIPEFGSDAEFVLRWKCPVCDVTHSALERYIHERDGKRHWLAALHQHIASHFTIEQLEALAPKVMQ